MYIYRDLSSTANSCNAAGFFVEALKNNVSLNTSYLVIAVLGISLAWLTNIYSIIVFASKAFAIYYALQLIITIVLLKKERRMLKAFAYGLLIVLMGLVIFWGIPVKE